MKIVSREQAQRDGLKFYFTGLPCVHGHIARRRTNNRVCQACAPIALKAWYYANHEAIKEKKRGDPMLIAKCRAYRTENPEKFRAAVARWADKNRDRMLASMKAYREANRPYFNAKAAERRAQRLNATPKWANQFFISEIYALARLRTKLTGIPWEVDHIVPLVSKLVCGLHVEFNLAVIPKSVNKAKNNRHWPDMPDPEKALPKV